jgi:hypothetical protein
LLLLLLQKKKSRVERAKNMSGGKKSKQNVKLYETLSQQTQAQRFIDLARRQARSPTNTGARHLLPSECFAPSMLPDGWSIETVSQALIQLRLSWCCFCFGNAVERRPSVHAHSAVPEKRAAPTQTRERPPDTRVWSALFSLGFSLQIASLIWKIGTLAGVVVSVLVRCILLPKKKGQKFTPARAFVARKRKSTLSQTQHTGTLLPYTPEPERARVGGEEEEQGKEGAASLNVPFMLRTVWIAPKYSLFGFSRHHTLGVGNGWRKFPQSK